jgi:hypothetical protein
MADGSYNGVRPPATCEPGARALFAGGAGIPARWERFSALNV